MATDADTSTELIEPSGSERKRTVEEFVRLFYEASEALDRDQRSAGAEEAPAWQGTRWFGVRALKLPLDLWVLQEIVFDTRPELIVETGVAEGGSTLFLASLLDLLGQGEVIGVDVDLSRVDQRVRDHPRISLIEGSSNEVRVVAHLEQAARGRRTMVDLDSDHGATHVLEELRALGPLVSPGCYLVVEDTIVNGNPVEPNFGPGPAEAISRWMEEEPPFEVDRSREHLLASFNSGGYLLRSGEPQAPGDAAAGDGIAPPEPAPDGRADQLAAREVAALRALLAERDADLGSLRSSLAASSRLIRELRAELIQTERLEELVERLELRLEERDRAVAHAQGEAENLRGQIEDRDLEIARLRTRLARIHGSLPMRVLNGIRWLPPLRWIFARRAREYWRQVG